MALLFMDGFDRYGVVGQYLCSNLNGSLDGNLAMNLEWNQVPSVAGYIVSFAAGRFGGLGLNMVNSAATNTGSPRCGKNLPGNIATLIFGVAFRVGLVGGAVTSAGIVFADIGTDQLTVDINLNGFVEVRRGGVAGTVLATSTVAVAANTWHYLEGQVTIHNTAGAWNISVDGSPVLSATAQNTRSSANNYANQVALNYNSTSDGGIGVTWDDLYVFDTTGTTNNAMRGDSRIDLLLPTSNNSVQFTPNTIALGYWQIVSTGGAVAPSANQLYLHPVTPNQNMTINSISVFNPNTQVAMQMRPVIYGDTAGHAGTLLSTGGTLTGPAANQTLVMPLTTPQALTAGTQYWIGFMNDVSGSNWTLANANNNGWTATSTFASGAPSTAPAMTGSISTRSVWGNCTTFSNNALLVATLPPLLGPITPTTPRGYVADSTVGHEDLYNMADMPTTPLAVGTVKLSAIAMKADAGLRTVDLRISSGGTQSGGSNTGMTPPASPGYITSYFDVDPNTSAAWTQAALNAMLCGVIIDT